MPRPIYEMWEPSQLRMERTAQVRMAADRGHTITVARRQRATALKIARQIENELRARGEHL